MKVEDSTVHLHHVEISSQPKRNLIKPYVVNFNQKNSIPYHVDEIILLIPKTIELIDIPKHIHM